MAEGPEEQPQTDNDDNPVVGDEDGSSDDENNSASSFSFILPVLITLIYYCNLII